VVGMAYAAVSVYWGLGGSWLVDTVGGTLEMAGRSGTAATVAAVRAAAVLKAVAAMIPVLYCRLSASRLRADGRPGDDCGCCGS